MQRPETPKIFNKRPSGWITREDNVNAVIRINVSLIYDPSGSANKLLPNGFEIGGGYQDTEFFTWIDSRVESELREYGS